MAQRNFEIANSPTWVKLLSACFIIYGLYIIVNAISVLDKYDQSQEFKDIIEEEWRESIPQGDTTLTKIEPTDIIDSVANANWGRNVFGGETEEIKTWEEIFSFFAIGLGICFILYAIALFVPKEGIVAIGVILLIISIMFSLFQAYIFITDIFNENSNIFDGFFTMFVGFGKLFTVIPDVGLLIFLLVPDKRFYNGNDDEEDDDLYEIEF